MEQAYSADAPVAGRIAFAPPGRQRFTKTAANGRDERSLPMRLPSSKLALLLGAASATLALAGAAHAQEAQAQTDSAQLDAIVVTAERRSENLQKVPLSVAAVGGEQLRAIQAGGDDILALSGKVPGLYAETTTGRIFPRFYIRGLGNIDFYLGASQPVSIIQDEIVLEHVVLKSNPLFDVKQVEVLRGPQGSLFGRNTTAGIVKFDTIKPSEDFKGRFSASYGSYGTTTFDGGVGGPIADGLMFRASVLYQHRDDWVDNTFAGVSADGTKTPEKNAMGGFTEKDARLQVLAKPNDKLSVLVSAHARSYEGTSTLFLRNALTKGSNDSSAPRDKVAFDEAANNPQAYDTYGISAHVDYDFGDRKSTRLNSSHNPASRMPSSA
jgi:iron complex outermembrane receptor protein